MRKILFIVLCAALLVGCKDKYNDWSNPQSNPQNPVLEDTVTVQVTPATTSIDFATYTADSVLLFTTSDPALRADSFSVDLTGDSARTSARIKASATGRIASPDLQDAVIRMYGHAGKERTLAVTVSQVENVQTQDGMVAIRYQADPFVLKAKLVVPFISKAYYFYGTAGSAERFDHSDKNVQDDPIFTIVFPGNKGEEEMWFAFTEEENIKDEWGNLNSWDEVYGYIGDETGTSGNFAKRTQLGKDDEGKQIENSFKVDGKAPYYRFTIDMLEATYRIEEVQGEEVSPILEIQPSVTSTLDFTDITTDSVQLFELTDTRDVQKFEVLFSYAEKDTVLAINEQGNIAVNDLKNLVKVLCGSFEVEHSLDVTVQARVYPEILQGKFGIKAEAKSFTITVKPFVPSDFWTDQNYYQVIDAKAKTVRLAKSWKEGELNIPEKVTNEEVDIEYTVTEVGNDEWVMVNERVAALTKLVIPATVTKIGSWAFASCDNLTSIYSKPDVAPEIGTDAFKSSESGGKSWDYIFLHATLYVPSEAAKETYKTAEWSYWLCFYENNRIVVDASIKNQ